MIYATAVLAMVKAHHSVFDSSVNVHGLVRIRKWQLTDLIIIQNSDAVSYRVVVYIQDVQNIVRRRVWVHGGAELYISCRAGSGKVGNASGLSLCITSATESSSGPCL